MSTHFGTVSPLSIFSIIQPLFLQKLSFYIQIPNIYLGLGLGFGPKSIRELAFVCPQSVVLTFSSLTILGVAHDAILEGYLLLFH